MRISVTHTSADPSHPQAGSATLSRDLADFLVEFQIALHKHAIYPAEHPLVVAAVDGVVRRLWALLADRQVLSIGVARKQLVIEGVATDANHALLRELAQRLHRHQVGALKLTAGIGADEIADLLASLGSEPARDPADALGARAETNERWAHVRVFPLTYGQLQLVDDAEGEEGSSAGAQLWVGLARAALSAERSPELLDEQRLEPVAVAKAIDDHEREVAYDQVVVGYLLQITSELRNAQGRETAALRRRISNLVGNLSPETLSTLLAMGGDIRQRRKFVLDAAQGMSVEAVVEVVRAAARTEGQNVSHSMLRLLSKLAQHAEADDARRRAADLALRENVTRLVGEWALEDPNPEAYNLVLQQFASGAAGDAGPDATAVGCEPERVLQMAIELDAHGPAARRATDALVGRRQEGIARLLDLLDGAPGGSDAARVVWDDLRERDPLRLLLAEQRPDPAVLQRLAARLGVESASPLLDALEGAADARLRELLAELLVGLGSDAGPFVARRVALVGPAVQRELLGVLGRLPDLPADFFPAAYLRSVDPLVRREALRLALRDGELGDFAARARVLRDALADPDPRVVFVALTAASERCPKEAIPVLLRRVEGEELDAGLRAHAIRVIAAQRDPAHIPWLVARMSTAPRFLRRARLLPTSPEMLAAVGALGAYWSDDSRAKSAIALAAAAHDTEIRQALAQGAQRLTPLRGAPRAEPTRT